MRLRLFLSALALAFCIGSAVAQINEQDQGEDHNQGGKRHHHEETYRPPVYEPEWIQPGLHPDRIVLNFGADPTSTAAATWRTSTEVSKGYAEIAKATGAPKFWRTAKCYEARTELLDGSEIKDAGIKANYHSVIFEDLEPNALYGYRVGDGEHWSEWFQFRTASKSDDAFTFLYVGDAQNYILELWSRLIRQGFQKAPDARFIIHAGDLVSEAHSEQQWEEWFRAGSFIHGMIPSFPIPGNHEYEPLYEGQSDNLEVLSVQWRKQFTLPENGINNIEALKETVYYMDFQGVRFIGLNSNEYKEEQAQWLRTVLEDNPNRWTIVTFHHPLYSASEDRSNTTWRNLLRPIFDEYGVDLVLQGHDHSYARGRVSPKGHNLTSGVNKQDQTGTVYVVSVSGGKMYDLRKKGWKDWGAERQRGAENTQLVQVLSVDKDTISYKSYTAAGELYDAFDLIKNHTGPNTLVDRQDEAIGARYHDNTIPYYDELPEDLTRIVLEKYKDYEIEKASIRPYKKRSIYYEVHLNHRSDPTHLEISIDEEGEIIYEERY